MFATTALRVAILSLTAVLIGFSGYMIGPALLTPVTDIYLEPRSGTVVTGDTFTIEVMVSSQQPVNVFQGELSFDPEKLAVSEINYNTSIADLWAELPWYSNGGGTLNFAGGSTRPGGFTGEGSLLQITFITKKEGEATITFSQARILKHDGLGTDVQLGNPIDAVFSVGPERLQQEMVVEKSGAGPQVTILKKPPSTDLNGDGKQTILDVSIFMSDFATQNKKSDFNLDGVVNLDDLAILNNR